MKYVIDKSVFSEENFGNEASVHLVSLPHLNLVALGILVLAGFFPCPVWSVHYWHGETDSLWNTATNWSTSSTSYTPATSPPTSETTVRFLNMGDAKLNFSNSQSGNIFIDGNSQVEFSSGQLTQTGRLRLGSDATTSNPVLTISGGEISSTDGFTVGVSTPATLNITGGKMSIPGFFNLHAEASKTMDDTPTVCNMSGGVVSGGWGIQFGECGYGIMNLTGGSFYGSSVYIGRNSGGDSSNGNGFVNIGSEISDGEYAGMGEMYLSGTLRHLALYSGLLSAKTIIVGGVNGCDTLFEGGTLVNETFTGNLTNAGTTIEMASSFAAEENFFKNSQDGTIGKLTVNGTLEQTDGKLVFDIASDTRYDQLSADALEIQLAEDCFPARETFYQLFSANSISSLDLALQVPGDTRLWSLTSDGRLHYQTADQVPEPSSWILLSGLFLLWGMYIAGGVVCKKPGYRLMGSGELFVLLMNSTENSTRQPSY